jgi:hypothetical protein
VSDQQPNPDTRWQWDDSLWGDTPAAPTSPEQVPDPDDECPGWLRRLLRWAARSP